MLMLKRLKGLFSHMLRELDEVVFTLVEIRKVLELTGEKDNKHEQLYFYCNWVLHSKLQGKSAQDVVRLFDRMTDLRENGGDADVVMEQLTSITSLTPFRDGLKTFLVQYGLDTWTIEVDTLWSEFVTGYLMVVQECPLNCVSQGLTHVDSVRLTVSDIKGPFEASQNDNVAAKIHWHWQSLKTGQIFTLTTLLKNEPLPPPQPKAPKKKAAPKRKRPAKAT
jgi:hypothetical protein